MELFGQLDERWPTIEQAKREHRERQRGDMELFRHIDN